MAVLPWIVSAMLLALLWVSVGVRSGAPTRAQAPAAALAPPPLEAVAEGRTLTRPVLHTSAALLAIALALDVSAPPASWAPVGAEAYHATAAEDGVVVATAQPQAWIPVEPATDWTFKAVAETDGWLI